MRYLYVDGLNSVATALSDSSLLLRLREVMLGRPRSVFASASMDAAVRWLFDSTSECTGQRPRPPHSSISRWSSAAMP